MGIYGALSTAVTGLQAQSYALENISGNIANSQTVGYKRIDTSFQDMIPDNSTTSQTAGSVVASARATNDVQGDISTSQTATNMAINGSGFFVVKQNTGNSDGHAVFSGANYYTRAGDFTVNKDGYLVNSAGYYLEGLPVDHTTGNASGSVPSVIQISNSLLPAQPTTSVNYQLNLPSQPQDAAYQAGVPGSELLQPGSYLPNTAPATATGTAALIGTDNAATVMAPGDSLTINVNGTATTFNFYDSTAGGTVPANAIDVSATTVPPVSINDALAAIQTQLRAVGGTNAASATVGLSTAGDVQVSLGSNLTSPMSITDNTTGLALGNQSVAATGATGPVNSIPAADNDAFVDQSTSGGAITVYGPDGSPANVVFRWAKTASAATGGIDTWNLFYASNNGATGAQTMWTNVGTNYTFGANGALNPPITSTTISNLNVDGVALGNLTLQHGTNGVTQFGDSSGSASVTTLTQDGYAAGRYTSVAIDNTGRVVASYSNGQQVAVAQVVTANFNGVDALKQLNGDAFAETTGSGSPVISIAPSITGSALEASNTDISSEFSNLIVTQQAYAAGTKIVTTANQMLQQALNMIQ